MSIRKTISGFSLIELIIFIVVVSVALVGVLSVMNLTTRHSADPMIHKQALAIAESMLEEIELQNFSNPTNGYTPAATATQADRPYLDDVSDYNGFTESGISTITGTAISGLSRYSLTVSVTPANLGPSSFANSQISTSNAKLITVTVTDPEGGTITLSGYRTNY
jgi:MSHA pilin protein MshD